MRILLLAPQPFLQVRGTPLAVGALVRVLAEQAEAIDLVAYHEGAPLTLPRVTLHRTPKLPFVNNIGPGFSWKKLLCDALMLLVVLRLVARRRYDLVHAVEESVFIALLLKLVLRVPYVYDMDSSLAGPLVDQRPALAPFAGLLRWLEALAVRHAKVVLPVCDALAEGIRPYGPARVVVLPDVSLLSQADCRGPANLRAELASQRRLVMYVGNLAPYQGIDLLLNSFALAARTADHADLVIVGGTRSEIARYRAMSRALGIDDRVRFLGPRPVEHLAAYLAAADILVSPRLSGNNTPMKVYSYLDSGRPLLATDLPTHTQVLDSQTALLAPPRAPEFADGLLRLVEDADLRSRLGAAGKQLVGEALADALFRERVRDLFAWLAAELPCDRASYA